MVSFFFSNHSCLRSTREVSRTEHLAEFTGQRQLTNSAAHICRSRLRVLNYFEHVSILLTTGRLQLDIHKKESLKLNRYFVSNVHMDTRMDINSHRSTHIHAHKDTHTPPPTHTHTYTHPYTHTPPTQF